MPAFFQERRSHDFQSPCVLGYILDQQNNLLVKASDYPSGVTPDALLHP